MKPSALRYFAAQFRPAWTPERADTISAKAYAERIWSAEYASARSDLTESEKAIFRRYLQPGQALLDIGCGVGREAFGFAQRGLCVTGIDVCSDVIARAGETARTLPIARRLSFHVASISSFDFGIGTFDAVYVSRDVYAGVPGFVNRVHALLACRRAVRHGGLVIFPVALSGPLSLGSRILVEGPRAVVRPLIPKRVPEFGDRWYPQSNQPLALFRHHFYDEAQVRSEVDVSGLKLLDRISEFFITQAPTASNGQATSA